MITELIIPIELIQIDMKAAILLSFFRRLNPWEQWFSCTQIEIEKLLKMSPGKQRSAIKILRKYGFIKTKISGCSAKQYYEVAHERIDEFIRQRRIDEFIRQSKKEGVK